MTDTVRSQETLLTAPWGRAGFHRWWGGWCESRLNWQTKQGERWGPAGNSSWHGHQQPCGPVPPPQLIAAYDEVAEISLQSMEGCSPSPGQHVVHMGAAWEIAEKPSHCSNSLPDYLGLQVHFVSLASHMSYSFLLYLFSAYLSISNLVDIHTNLYAYVYTSLRSRSDLYIYRPDLVLLIAQLWEIGLDLQNFLPANISVIFILSYVHHYTQLSSCGYHFVQYFLAESPAAHTEMQLVFFMWTIQLSYWRCLFITNQVKWRRQK